MVENKLGIAYQTVAFVPTQNNATKNLNLPLFPVFHAIFVNIKSLMVF